MGVESYICSQKCWGVDNYYGSCCHLEDRDWIIGANVDVDEFIKNLSISLGREIKKEEVFIEYEEGKNLFPERTNWQNPNNYPALRFDDRDPKRPCIFYNTSLKFCSVYDIRPHICQKYKCDYLKKM